MVAFENIYSAVLVLWLSSTLPGCEPIMVSFGTSKGPILPRQEEQPEPVESSLQPKTIVTRSPAPVKEDRADREDTPNPNNYQPLIPHQYRDKLLAFRPPQNLILGTPVDQMRYTPSLEKYNIYRKQLGRSDGVEYTGPHTFDNSLYYNNFQPKKITLQPSVRYSKEELQRRGKTIYPNSYPNAKWVPQIGVVYSAGVRYYVPQVVYYDQQQNNQNGEEENSVYDKNDEKYYHYERRQ